MATRKKETVATQQEIQPTRPAAVGMMVLVRVVEATRPAVVVHVHDDGTINCQMFTSGQVDGFPDTQGTALLFRVPYDAGGALRTWQYMM